jgi:hypothetical protein
MRDTSSHLERHNTHGIKDQSELRELQRSSLITSRTSYLKSPMREEEDAQFQIDRRQTNRQKTGPAVHSSGTNTKAIKIGDICIPFAVTGMYPGNYLYVFVVSRELYV